LEEHDNDGNGIKDNNNDIKDRQVGGMNDPPAELDISHIPLDPAADNKPAEDAHLDISNIEERKEEDHEELT
jgi:hypothetical protein